MCMIRTPRVCIYIYIICIYDDLVSQMTETVTSKSPGKLRFPVVPDACDLPRALCSLQPPLPRTRYCTVCAYYDDDNYDGATTATIG